MTDGELLCNFTKCRKILTDTAFITRCSHAFCEEDGIKQIENQRFEKKCPACQSPLVKNYDLVRVTLNPNDQFKSMVLAGLRPEIVMDIATRAITFWSYQQHQEQLNQSLISKNLKEIITQIKNESEVENGFLKSEIQNLKKKQEDLEKELEKQNVKCNELCEKISHKTRDIQKWQMMYESLRRKQLSNTLLQRESNVYETNPIALNVGPQTMHDLFVSRDKALTHEYRQKARTDEAVIRKKSPNMGQKDQSEVFVFEPRTVNTYTSPKMFHDNDGIFRFQNRRYHN